MRCFTYSPNRKADTAKEAVNKQAKRHSANDVTLNANAMSVQTWCSITSFKAAAKPMKPRSPETIVSGVPSF
eukprot:1158353-Pelagomonas_calceolata.AAC.2